MAGGYSGTPLWKKLGVKPGSHVVLRDAPRGWSVGELPDGATVAAETSARGDGPAESERPDGPVVAFCEQLASLQAQIAVLAGRIFPEGSLWIAWPRRAGGHDSDIREQDIRDCALPLGLVDVKVAALDEDWSGLKLVWRREHRAAPTAPGGASAATPG